MKVDDHLAIAGFNFGRKEFYKYVFQGSIVLLVLAFIVWTIITIPKGYAPLYFVFLALTFIFVGYPGTVLTSALLFWIYSDLRIISRKKAIEKVLPEFLQLAAANIRAGMPIDQALWSAVRPRFGVLATEIEIVAKQTMVGESLPDSLLEFARKYDSLMLSRTMHLLVEGLEAGSEIGDLLEELALSIQDIQIRRESMAANVTTYVIFIGFSVMIAAPLLFGVSMQMLRVVQTLGEKVGSQGGGPTGISFTLSTSAVQQSDFFIFCIVSLLLTSAMSSIIISAIKSGDVADALKTMPMYMAVSVGLFIIAQFLLGFVFAGLL